MSLTDRFAMLWEDDGPPPDVFAFLKTHAEVSPRECVDVLLIDQHHRRRTGRGHAVEAYLREFPEIAADAELKLDLVFGELRTAPMGQGGTPVLDPFFARFPDLAEELVRQFEVADWMETRADSSLGDPDTLSILESRADEPTVRDVIAAAARRSRPGSPRSAWASSGLELLGRLGRGGMGVVYLVRQVALDRVCALKMTHAGEHAGPEQSSRFRTEVRALARLTHPNFVQIHETGELDGRPYFLMEYVDGGSLARKLSGGPLPIRQAARIVEVLARAMGFAHRRGVVHRDLKPANILLTRDGRIKIADLGLATIDGARESGGGSILGTPAYMAPEQAQGLGSGPPIDIYSLGATLYELLTGRPPFRRPTTYGTLVQVLNEEPVPPGRLRPELPRDLEAICLKCLEKDPRRRYAGAEELAEDLRAFLGGRRRRGAPRRSDGVARPHRRPVAGHRLGRHARGPGHPAAAG